MDPQIINKMPAIGMSFPSGHSLSAALIAAFLIFIILKTVKNKKMKIFLICLTILFVLLVIFSRLYLGQHYLSDTLAAIVLAGVYSAISLYLYNKNKFIK